MAGYESETAAREIFCACARDLLFWVNAFGWTYDPRLIEQDRDPRVPFITWDVQDRILSKLNAAIGHHDMGIEKSRGMGASWMQLLVFFWRWHFLDRPSDFLVVSRKEQYVDDAASKKSLFWKLRMLYEWMPSWMKQPVVDTKMKLLNLANGSTIDGESTTDNIARGARYTAILVDEFAAFEMQAGYKVLAAMLSATNTRMYNSTYAGAFGAFYDRMQQMKREHPEHVERLHWSDHPDYSAGKYRSTRGRLEKLDRSYEYPDNYQFILDEKLRSPWYDEQCRLTPIPRQIAEELDIDPQGAGGPFFDRGIIDECIARARAPESCGELRFNPVDCEPEQYVITATGRLKFWIKMDLGRPPKGKYGIAADVSQGTGASNSCLTVVDLNTGRKVASFVDPHSDPIDLADMAVALGKWFYEAKMIWEGQGPGIPFGKQVTKIRRYGYVYKEVAVSRKMAGEKPGWMSNDKKKQDLLRRYEHGLARQAYDNPDIESLRETLDFIFDSDKRVVHASSLGVDPSGAGDNHGDRAMADAMAYKLVEESGPVLVVEERGQKYDPENPPVGSWAWIEQQIDEREAASSREQW